MKVTVQGQGDVSLDQKDFIAAGGEGQVYCKGGTAFKIYLDPARMLPLGKIHELSRIQDPDVIKPEHIILDSKQHQPIGYTMRYVANTLPLCQIFTRTFRERNGVDHSKMLALVQHIQHMVDHIHAANVLLVDLNELNFLVDAQFQSVYSIDVDSFQTAGYPATAIMPSVRDWSVQGNHFSEGSDWFSFACVAYQMFTGIHPYRGKHPTVASLEDRMRQNISVFDPTVHVPKVVYSPDIIPSGYREWFKAVLQNGLRIHPPTNPMDAIILHVPVAAVTSQDNLDIQSVRTYTTPIIWYVEYGQANVAVGQGHTCYVNGTQQVATTRPIQGVGFTAKSTIPVGAWIDKGILRLQNLRDQSLIPLDVSAQQIMFQDGRIYVQSGDRVCVVTLTETSSKVMASLTHVTNILPLATQMYPGMVRQSLLGACYLTLFSALGAHQVRVPELDYGKLVDAKHDNHVVMCIVYKNGKYHRLVFEFSDDYNQYTLVRDVADITPTGLNFITLDNKVYILINEDEDLEIASIGNPKVKVIKSHAISGDMNLVKHNGRVGFTRGNQLYAMRMK